MSRKPARARRLRDRSQASPAGYVASVLVSAVLTTALLIGLVAALRPDALSAPAAAQAVVTPVVPEIPPTDVSVPTPVLSAVIRSNQPVNVRSGPGTNFEPVTAASPGTAVTVTGQDGSGAWYSVRLPDGREGWVAAELLALDSAPSASVAQAPSPTPDTTPTPELVVCDPETLRAWWATAVQAYYQMMFTLDQINQGFDADDYQRLFDAARAAYRAFDDAGVPACVAPAQAELQRGFDETLAAVRDSANNNAASAANHARAARSAMDTALAVLAAEQNLAPNKTGCSAEFWNAGIAADVDRVFALVGSVNVNTSAVADLRSTIFDLQRIRRYLAKLAVPECVKLASQSLLDGIDSYIAMYQAAALGDRAAAANAEAAATGQINTFRAEMRKLGL